MNEVDEDDGVLDLMIKSMTVEADDVLRIDLIDPEGGILPEWTAGSHIDLIFDGLVKQYSLCGAITDQHTYTVAVLREPSSRGGSAYVHGVARPGDMVEVAGPRNHFQLGSASGYIFIAGGIGITPILPMIAQAEREGTPWRLFYGGRSRTSMAFTDHLAGYGDKVSLHPEDEVGLLDVAAITTSRPRGAAVYCCGPAGLIDAVENSVDDWQPGELNLERFVAKDFSALESRPLTVHCSRSAVDLEVGATESVLDALESAGIPVPNACRDGVCGSCEVAVLGGVPEHRDSFRSSADDMSSIAVCVSRAKTTELVLDL